MVWQGAERTPAVQPTPKAAAAGSSAATAPPAEDSARWLT